MHTEPDPVAAGPEGPGDPFVIEVFGVRWELVFEGLSAASVAELRALWSRAAVDDEDPAATDRATPPRFVVRAESPAPDAEGVTASVDPDEQGTVVGTDPEAIPYNLSRAITLSTISRRRGEALMLHAVGVCGPDGRTVALVAPSGTGKTTAAKTLGRALGYVTDETVVIEADDSVSPYAKPLSIITDPERPYHKSEHGPDDLGLLRPPTGDHRPHITAVVVLRRDPTLTDPVFEMLPLIDGILDVVPESSALPALPDPLHRLCQVLTRSGGPFALTYPEIADCVDIVTGLTRPHAGRDADVMSWEHVPGEARPAADRAAERAAAWGCVVERRSWSDAIISDGEALLLQDLVPVRLSRLGTVLWSRAAEPTAIEILHDEVVAAIGANPHSAGLVLEAVQALIEAGVLAVTGPEGEGTDEGGTGEEESVEGADGALTVADLVETTQALRATTARREKVAVIADLLSRTPPTQVEALVGMLLGRIRQGRIGIGGKTLQRAMAEAAGPPNDPNDPKNDHSDKPTDNSPSRRRGLSLSSLDAALSRIAGLTGPGSTAARASEIEALVRAAAPMEREQLARILLGDTRTGALDGIVTDALARAIDRPPAAVRRAVMVIGDLGTAAAIGLRNPDTLLDSSLRVGTAVQPMLASSAPDVTAALAITGPASVEHKLDGARIQVHRKGPEVSVHTRSLADITDRVPEIVAFVRGLEGTEFILDGETLMLDESGTPRPFQETMSRFGSTSESGVVGTDTPVLAPRFFDLLSADGEDLTGRPLADRRRRLAGLVGDHHLVPGEVTDDPVVAERVLSDALALGHEGVVVKAIDSPYAAGRRGKSWVKVKPVLTHDLVVLAAEWGYGRRTGWLSNLHLGARDPEGRFGPPGGFVMVGKTFKGLTDETLRWQTETFPAYAVEPAGQSAPHVLHLRPEIVVEIAIDGVQRSSRYPGGLALRFARVKGYRTDKAPAEADTIESLRSLLRD